MNEEHLECECACKDAHTLFTGQREREKGRERNVELSNIVIFILKKNDRCLGTFYLSSLV